jgi:hypothetical protein
MVKVYCYFKMYYKMYLVELSTFFSKLEFLGMRKLSFSVIFLIFNPISYHIYSFLFDSLISF